jgi:hypothetical protein
MIRDEDFLSVEQVLTKLKEAADKQRPFVFSGTDR